MFFREKEITQTNYQAIAALFLVMLVNYTYYYKAIAGSQLYAYMAVIVPCCYLTSGGYGFRRLVSGWNLVFLLACASFLLSSYFSVVSGFGFSVYFLLGVMLLFSLSLSEKAPSYIIRFSLYFSLIYVAITIYSVAFTSEFINNLSLFYAEPQLSDVGYLIQSNGYAGIAGHTDRNGFFISVVVGILFVRLFYRSGYTLQTLVLYALAFAALSFTARRGPFLGNVVATVLVSFFLLYKTGSSWKFFATVLLLAAAFFLAPYIPQVSGIFERNEELIQSNDFTNGRMELYDFAFYLFDQKPWFGHGPLTYVALRQNHTGNPEMTLSAHNSYLQLLAETGIIGAALFVLCLLVILCQTVISLKHSLKTGAGGETMIATSLYVQLVFIVLCFSESIAFEFQALYTYFLFASIPLCYYQKFHG